MNHTDDLFRLRPEFSRCPCRCHGQVLHTHDRATDAVVMRAYIQNPPRFDDAMAWAESCAACEFKHFVAASVSAQVDMLEATELENGTIYRVRNHT